LVMPRLRSMNDCWLFSPDAPTARLYLRSSVVPQFRGSVVPQFRNFVVPWFRSFVVPWFRGSVVPWFRSSAVPQFRSSLFAQNVPNATHRMDQACLTIGL
jgi:hypothetical protein